MSKRSPTRQGSEAIAPASPPGATPALPWSSAGRGVASALILLHLAAVVLAALVATPPFSELWTDLAWAFRPYVNAADLNHGYRFFAPDPGPSHLVEYHLEFVNGKTRDGRFPDLNEERPRLLYHRYFMLSEHLFNYYAASQSNSDDDEGQALPPDVQAKQTAFARSNAAGYRALGESYARELLRRSGAKRVTLELVEHRIPLPDDVARGERLDDPKLYIKLKNSRLGPFDAAPAAEALP